MSAPKRDLSTQVAGLLLKRIPMLRALFACASCGSPRPESFPLCRVCRESLVPCPELCAQCGSPVCGSSCRKAWAPLGPLRSLHAAYLFLGLGHEVLKRWKFHPGPFLDQAILTLDASLASRLGATGARTIVAVPQRFERAWELGGGSSARIAAWLSRELGIPARGLLKPGVAGVRQSASSAELRFQNLIRFEPVTDGRPVLEPILLVDDFATTGHTLRSAARALGAGGWSDVHAFCLGLKLRRLEKQSRDLRQSAGWPVAVGQEGGVM